jgi:predicted outer membrane protein
MRNAFAGLALASAVFCGVTLAQNAQQPQAQPRQPQAQPQRQPAQPPRVTQPAPGQPRVGQPSQQLAQPGGQTSSADQQIAALIHGGSHNEIELSKFAQSKLQNSEARAFAEKMISDHTADAESYLRWSGKQGDAALRHEGDTATAGKRPGQPGAEGQETVQRRGPLDWNLIHEQLAQQCLESAKQELGRHQGANFDQAFMGMQLAGHMKMQDELKVLKNHASPELRQQIDKSLQVVQGHLQEARQIKEQLKDSPSERVSRRPEGKQ